MEVIMRRALLFLLFLPLLSLPLFAHETGFPGETLKKVYPNATGFTARKKTLTAVQLRRVQRESGSRVHSNDNPFEYYVALGKSADGTGVLGTVLMIDVTGPKGGLDLAVGIERNGAVHRVVVEENHDDPGLSSAAFLNQIRGKTIRSPLKVGRDIKYSGNAKSAQAVLNAVRRGLYLLAAAEGK